MPDRVAGDFHVVPLSPLGFDAISPPALPTSPDETSSVRSPPKPTPPEPRIVSRLGPSSGPDLFNGVLSPSPSPPPSPSQSPLTRPWYSDRAPNLCWHPTLPRSASREWIPGIHRVLDVPTQQRACIPRYVVVRSKSREGLSHPSFDSRKLPFLEKHGYQYAYVLLFHPPFPPSLGPLTHRVGWGRS
jgi:hypothetical protein